LDWINADFSSAAVAPGNREYKSAMVPVTKGAAALVPLNVRKLPSVPRLMIALPGAIRPCLPIECPRFE
jgi:hypothetical protein